MNRYIFLSNLSQEFHFFFQAEDGIRYDLVTGVQTCALPISHAGNTGWSAIRLATRQSTRFLCVQLVLVEPSRIRKVSSIGLYQRSEERRVGKKCNSKVLDAN